MRRYWKGNSRNLQFFWFFCGAVLATLRGSYQATGPVEFLSSKMPLNLKKYIGALTLKLRFWGIYSTKIIITNAKIVQIIKAPYIRRRHFEVVR